jgi:hypothetical protein
MSIFIGNHTKIKKILKYVSVSQRKNHPVFWRGSFVSYFIKLIRMSQGVEENL